MRINTLPQLAAISPRVTAPAKRKETDCLVSGTHSCDVIFGFRNKNKSALFRRKTNRGIAHICCFLQGMQITCNYVRCLRSCGKHLAHAGVLGDWVWSRTNSTIECLHVSPLDRPDTVRNFAPATPKRSSRTPTE